MSDVDQWMIFARAFCEDCDWNIDAKNAQALAAQHADKYGHTVKGELGYSYEVEPENQSLQTGTERNGGDDE